MPYSVRLFVDGASTPLGVVVDADHLPGVLRHVADYYELHPDACARLFARTEARAVPPLLAQPFSGAPAVVHPVPPG